VPQKKPRRQKPINEFGGDLESTEVTRGRLAAIVESSDDAIVSKNLNGIITSWNAGAERLFGYQACEAIGQPVAILIPPERINEEPGILDRIRRGERIDHYETVRVRKDGTKLNISLTVSPILDAHGHVIGASKTARDITDRKRMEAELKAWNEQLESRVLQQKIQLLEEAKERKRLEAEIADAVEAERLRLGQELHDGLAQELTGLGMMLDVLGQKLVKISPTRSRELHKLRLILASTVDKARTLAKGFYPVEIERHGLLIALQEVAAGTERLSGIRCTVEADDHASAWSKDSRSIQLFRIAQEGIHNAVKHSKARHIVVRLSARQGERSLVVQDDGVGLGSNGHQNGGLGLRIMQYRARMIGGTCELKNVDGRGAVLICSIPDGPATNETGSP
jgi:PAS domain S-box-containing protein